MGLTLLDLLGVRPVALYLAQRGQRHLAAQYGDERFNTGFALSEAPVLDIEADLPVGGENDINMWHSVSPSILCG
jgi:hypothetical protein